ncbi:hypothetical protein QBC35DRAFT_108401 [Podospora australis]|uniref:Uncharacterized protein n=1 Tax=Podospora australis TaxID=1536484 RepID=A0AAN6X5Y3_9PEZI|nr:hypothetical protein QBC35DRAFT_108401 [Podospora australis]
MKGRPIDQLVYEYMFPNPRPTDPQNFSQLLQRSLVLEVRQEVHAFYGHLDTPEAKYPGLDYTHPIHRIRLSRWTWHRRLFRAFDGLRLTHGEISGLTKWEGTKWAKERYEKEQGVKIRDTTADFIARYVEPELRTPDYYRRSSPESDDTVPTPEDEDQQDEEEEESDEELESVGVALNERLRERVALRSISGDNTISMDEEWENWLKNAIESGELPHVANQIARFPDGGRNTLNLTDILPPDMIDAARAGHWDEIPDFLHDMLRQQLALQIAAPTASLRHYAPPSVSVLPPRAGGVLPRVDMSSMFAPGTHPRRSTVQRRLPVDNSAAQPNRPAHRPAQRSV